MELEFIRDLLSTLLLAVVTGILPTVLISLMKMIDKRQEQYISAVKNETIRMHINSAIDLIQAVVLDTTQTFVEPLKDLNEWDAVKAEEAKQLAIDKVLQMLSTEGTELLKEVYGDLVLWIGTQIEAYLKSLDLEKEKVITNE